MSTATTGPIAAAMEQDPSIVVLAECFELSEADSALKASYPDRHFLLPSSDSTLAGVAFGMAVDGRKPVVRLPDTQSLIRLWPTISEQNQLHFSSSALVYELPCAPTDSQSIAEVSDTSLSDIWAAVNHNQQHLILQQAVAQAGSTVLLSCLNPEAQSSGTDTIGDPAPWLPLRSASDPWATMICWGHGSATSLAVAADYAIEGCEIEVIALQHLTPTKETIAALSEQLARSGRLISVALPTSVQQALLSAAFWSLEAPPQSCPLQQKEIRQALDEALRY